MARILGGDLGWQVASLGMPTTNLLLGFTSICDIPLL